MRKLEEVRYFWWQYKRASGKTTGQMLKSWWGPLRVFLNGGEVHVYNWVKVDED